MNRYWVGQIGASFTVHAPDGQLVAFRPDQESAERARDRLNEQAALAQDSKAKTEVENG
jgi:hypothetical protein